MIANGRKEKLSDIIEGKIAGTLFLPQRSISSNKAWIGLVSKPKGRILIDDGAADAILRRKSLLSAGIRIVAVGIIKCSSEDLSKILENAMFKEEICQADRIMIRQS